MLLLVELGLQVSPLSLHWLDVQMAWTVARQIRRYPAPMWLSTYGQVVPQDRRPDDANRGVR